MDIKTIHEASKHHAAGLFAAAMSRSSLVSAFCKSIEDAQPQHVKDARALAREESERRARAAKEQLLTKLTPEFLDTLAVLSRYAGESTEYGPVVNVLEAFRLAGRSPEDVSPTNFWGT